jgi:hypothetical protein
VTKINEISFSLVWCRFVPETLVAPFGMLTSGAGYRSAFTDGIPGVEFHPPWWDRDTVKWSRFWSSYLHQARAIREISADAAWDFLLPLALSEDHVGSLTGPVPETTGGFDVWLFPHAVVVIATVVASGSWSPSEAAAAAAALPDSNGYERDGHGHRNLDGLASDFADLGAAILTPSAPQSGVANPLAIAAGIEATGDASALEITKPAIAKAVAGMAQLATKGTPNAAHLLEANTDPRRAGRVYWESEGHVIWNADAMIATPERSRCIQRNHTHALAVTSAFSALVTWAAEEVRARRPVPGQVHDLLARCMHRLAQLDEGDKNKTYRSGIVQQRIVPVRPDMDTVRNAGLPSHL